jgi:hypothetical protein
MKKEMKIMGIRAWVTLAATSLLMASAVFAKQPDAAVVKQQEQRTQATIDQIRLAIPNPTAGKSPPTDAATCYACHKDIKEFHANSKHASVNCSQCHTKPEEHLAKDGKAAIGTRTDHAACAAAIRHSTTRSWPSTTSPRPGSRREPLRAAPRCLTNSWHPMASPRSMPSHAATSSC